MMKIKLSMLFILMQALILLHIANCQKYQHDRLLQTWSSFVDCSNCNNISGCVYLNDTWQPEYSNLQYTAVSSSNSIDYWHASLGNTYILLKDHKYNLDLYKYDNASLSTYPLCEWRILNDDSK